MSSVEWFHLHDDVTFDDCSCPFIDACDVHRAFVHIMSSEAHQGEAENDAVSSQPKTRYDCLKEASIEHYMKGVSLKQAAKKYGVGVRELKEFYENQAASFVQNKDFHSSDGSDDDP